MHSEQLDPRPVVIITGGGSGIGAAAAERLAQDYRVVICGRRQSALDTVAARTGAVPMALDVTDYPANEALVAEVAERFGRLDALVLNAGVVLSTAPHEITIAQWEAQIAVNLTGAFVMTRAALPHLLRAKGAVVSVSSVGAMQTGPGLAAYSTAKAGLSHFTCCLAYEYARQGLRANVVAPGWIRSEMADEEMKMLPIGRDLDAAYAKVSEHVPQRRAGSSMEAAEAIAFLLSPAASFINGAVLPVDGGSLIANSGMTYFDTVAS